MVIGKKHKKCIKKSPHVLTHVTGGLKELLKVRFGVLRSPKTYPLVIIL